MDQVRLKRLIIKDFRGFYKLQSLKFAIPNEKPGSGLTVIVGPNNSGKSTILEAIKRFAKNAPQFKVGERHNNCNILLKIENTKKEEKIIQTYGGSNADYKGREIYPAINNFYLISARKYWQPFFSPLTLNRNSYKNTLFSINRSGSDSSFGQRIADIEKNSTKRQRFNELMKSLLPSFKFWVIDLDETGQNYIKYTTGKGDTHNSDYWGDGIISLFKIVAAIIEEDKQEVLVIDEPELSLHPQLQKRLAKVLSDYSREKQIILITHSPYFVRWGDLKNGSNIIRLNKKEDKQCKIFSLKRVADYYEKLITFNENWHKPHILDIVAKELFFAENIVFVEGQEDVGLLKKFIFENNININFDIFGYGSDGAGNIQYFLEIAKDLGIDAGAIFDADQTILKNKVEKQFPEFCIKQISKDDIRDKFNKEGLFNKDGEIKIEHKEELTNFLISINDHFENL